MREILKTNAGHFLCNLNLAGCVPIKNTLQNGSMERSDSEDGGTVYKFHCDKGFRLNGAAVIHCQQGQWNGSEPNCEPKGEYFLKNKMLSA